MTERVAGKQKSRGLSWVSLGSGLSIVLPEAMTWSGGHKPSVVKTPGFALPALLVDRVIYNRDKYCLPGLLINNVLLKKLHFLSTLIFYWRTLVTTTGSKILNLMMSRTESLALSNTTLLEVLWDLSHKDTDQPPQLNPNSLVVAGLFSPALFLAC